jgi:hypothetical protein
MQIEISDDWLLAFCGAQAGGDKSDIAAAVKNYLYGQPATAADRTAILGRMLVEILELSLNH